MTSSRRQVIPGPDMDKLIQGAAKQLQQELSNRLNTALQNLHTVEAKLAARNAKLQEQGKELTKLRAEVKRLTKEVNTLRYVAEQKGVKAKKETSLPEPPPLPTVVMKAPKCRDCGGPHYTAFHEDAA